MVKDMIGKRYGRFIVISFAFKNKYKQRCYLCICDCGLEKIVNGGDLQSGRTLSCGCYNKDQIRKLNSGIGNIHYKHGGKHTKLYGIWRAIIERCYYLKHISYKYYGNKGISVCSGWKDSFLLFREWAIKTGYKEGLSIDRIDHTGNYEPSNCQWLTRSENTAKSNRERVCHV